MITIASESNYANSLTFDSIEAVEAEAADCSRYANRADYPSDIAYIANLLDLPESHVRVEEVITLTRSQLEAHDREVTASERRAAMLEVLDLLSARGGWGDYLGRDGSQRYGFALRPPISGAATGLFDWLREQADQIEAGDSND